MAVTEDEPVEPAGDPPERLSWPRLAAVLIVVGLAVAAIVVWVRDSTADETPLAESTSVPYVDVTLTPTYPFQDPQANPARSVALGFVVADPDDACAPSWGGYYSLDEADAQLELTRRLDQLRGAGGSAIVSFGGQANTELGLACGDLEALTDAYLAVVERYDVPAIDLDIEGDELGEPTSRERRAAAVAAVQRARADADEDLAVWVTLPVSPGGLTEAGVAEVDALLAAGVELAGVNTMTMNFGNADEPTADMFAATASALERTASQLIDVYAAHGSTLDHTQAWGRLGATPMIGQNDVAGEIFTVDDAVSLAELATQRGLGRVSFWSLNRDAPCSAFPDVAVLSTTCSGVAQDPLDFAAALGNLGSDGLTVVAAPEPVFVDDPTRSPYPIWRSDAEYQEGYKVVRRGMVYQARWYTSGEDPAAASVDVFANPWSLVGPVSPDDEPFTPATVAPGTHPEWAPAELYQAGDEVLFEGLPYRARWANQGEPPQTLFPVASNSAWEPQFAIPGQP